MNKKTKSVFSFAFALSIPFLLGLLFIAAIILVLEAAFNADFLKSWRF